jgi:hypothetical protein
MTIIVSKSGENAVKVEKSPFEHGGLLRASESALDWTA